MSKPLHVEPLERRAYLTIAFAAPVHFAVPSLERGVLTAPAVGDFDGDGRADLVVGNATDLETGTTNLIFAKGDGAGNFTPAATPVTPGVFTSQPKAGDFNNDDKLDIVVTSEFNNLIRVLLGNGNGTFQAPVNINVGTAPGSAAVADLNGDGADDVVINNRGDVNDRGNDTVSVLLGGATGLGAPANINVGDDPASTALADVNADSRLDLIVGNGGGATATAGSIMTFLGNGNGTFATTPVTTAGPRGVSDVADFNGDGRLDVLLSVAEGGTVTILPGNGNGSFQNVAAPAEDQFLAAARDFDGDGKVDIAYVRQVGEGTTARNFLTVQPGVGDGTFGARQDTEIAGAGSFAPGELNGDAKPDLALASFAEGPRMTTLINQSTAGGNPNPGTGPDLTAEITGKAPVAVIAGTTKGRFAVRVVNASTDTALDRTPVTVRLVASADAAAGTGDTELGTVTKTVRLRPGRAARFNVPFTYPTIAADGAYNILAVVDPDGTVTESNKANNTAAFATPVTIAAPFVDLQPAFATAVPATLAAGRNTTFTLTITNAGNVPARGALPTGFTASTDNAASPSDITLGAASPRVNIGAGKSKRVRFRVGLPGTIAAGQYFVLASINQGAAIPESNTGNNVAASAQQTTVSS